MEKYVKAIKMLLKLFKSFPINQIPRSENSRADTLRKLASTCFGHISKEVLVEVIKERRIEEHQAHTLSPA